MHFNIELIRKISFNMNLKLQISRIIRVAINREKVALIPGIWTCVRSSLDS